MLDFPRATKHINDLEALECIWPGPEKILKYSDFRGYQIWMSEKMKEIPAALYGAEMGLGKTAAVLKAISDLLAEGEVKHVLIIAPLRVSELTWPEEIATWEFARHIPYRIVTGDADQRKAALALKGRQITIINRENLLWLYRMHGPKGWPYDMIVYDEASRLKAGKLRTTPNKRKDGTRGAARLTELGVITRMRHRAKRVIELSGTPSPNGLIDLYGPIYAVDQGKRLGNSFTAYKNRWFVEDRYTYAIEPRYGAEEEITDAIKDVFFALREEDYLTLPPLIERDHVVQLPPKAMSQYREMEKEMVVEVLDKWSEEQIIEAMNSGVLIGKLLQMANGSIYNADQEALPLHTAKLDALDSIVEEAAGKPMLVAYSFKFDKEAILKRYKFAKLFDDSPNIIRDWNAGKIRMLLVHPASAGHGLNFQKGSNISVWYGLTWSLELYKQFIKRLHRSGQKEDRVFLHRILAEGTADFNVLGALATKGARQDNIMNAVRVRLEALR